MNEREHGKPATGCACAHPARYRTRAWLAGLLVMLAADLVHAGAFQIPNGPLPEDCERQGRTIQCEEDIELGGGDRLEITGSSAYTLDMNGNDLSLGNGAKVNSGGSAADLVITGVDDLELEGGSRLTAQVQASGDISVGSGVRVDGSLSAQGDITLEGGSRVDGDVDASGDVTMEGGSRIDGDVEAGGDLELGGGSEINGCETVGGNLDNNGTINCDEEGGETPELLVHYRFDESAYDGTADEVKDQTGQARHATTSGVFASAGSEPALSGDPGTCRYAEADGGHAEDGDAAGYLADREAITVMAWVRNTDAIGNNRGIFTANDPDGKDNGLGLRYDSDGWGSGGTNVLKASLNTDQCNDGGDCVQVETESDLQVRDEWQHVTMTWESGEKIRIYINGSEVATEVTSSGLPGGALDNIDFLRVGQGNKDSGSAGRWQGGIDEFRVYAGALDQSAIQEAMDARHACPGDDGGGGCGAIFPSAMQNSTGAGKIEFGWNAQVTDPDNSLETANSIEYDPSGADTCGSTDCTATGTPSVEPTLEPFKTSPGATDVDLSWKEDYTLGSGGVSEYRDITGGERSTITDGGGQQVYRIRTLTLDWRDELVLRGGVDYWIENLEVDDENDIKVEGSGTARLFIGNEVEFTWKAAVNGDGEPEDLLIVGYDDINLATGDPGSIDAVVYSAGEITTGSSQEVNGALAAAGDLTLGSDSQVSYDASAVNAVAAGGFCGGGAALDHVRVEHDGSGVTCRAEPVRLEACTDPSCTGTLDEAVTVNLDQPATGWPDSVEFTGSTTVDLSNADPGKVTLGVSAADAANDPVYVNTGSGADRELVFADTGILIDGDDGDNTDASPLPTQIAGKNSSSAPQAATQRLRVVRTDDNTGACVPALDGEIREVTFGYRVPDGRRGSSNAGMVVAGPAGATASLTAETDEAAVDLSFDGQGSAPFTFTPNEAGEYALEASLSVPVTDEQGNETGESRTVSGSSASFVSRPFALRAVVTDNPAAADHEGAVFRAAGDPMEVVVTAVGYQASDDSDGDGIPDGHGDTDPTNNANLADNPALGFFGPETVRLVGALHRPDGGHDPGLDGGPIGVDPFSGGQSAGNEVNWPEVGIMELRAGLADGDYLGSGAGVVGRSGPVGRFVPDRFEVVDTTVVDRVQRGCAADDFTYLGEQLAPEMTLEARNAAGSQTRNYRDAFASLGPGDVQQWAALDGPTATDLSGRLSAHVGAFQVARGWADTTGSEVGRATFRLPLTLARGSEADGPWTAVDFGFSASDADGVTVAPDLDSSGDGSPDRAGAGETELRYGRLTLESGHVAEFAELGLKLTSEFWAGSDAGFRTNGDDDCTPLEDAAGSRFRYRSTTAGGDFGPWGNAPSLGETAASLDPAAALSAGEATLTLEPPETPGRVEVCLDLTGLSFLGFPWPEPADGVLAACSGSPVARATFGVDRGNEDVLFTREVFE